MGEMEVWGLEAHRAAYALQEMLTIKSDDMLGRAKAFEAIVKGLDIPDATVPESFRVLVRELNSLGLSIDAEGSIYVEDNKDEDVEKAQDLLRDLGEGTVEVPDTMTILEPTQDMAIVEE